MTDKLKELALECKEREIDFDDVSPNQGSTSCNKLVRHYIAAASPDAILALISDLENERRKVSELVDGYEKDQAELKRLRSTIYTDNSQTVAYATKRIAELEAEVERLKAQEPVGWVMHVLECSTLFLEKPDPNAIPLFFASGAAQKETDRG